MMDKLERNAKILERLPTCICDSTAILIDGSSECGGNGFGTEQWILSLTIYESRRRLHWRIWWRWLIFFPLVVIPFSEPQKWLCEVVVGEMVGRDEHYEKYAYETKLFGICDPWLQQSRLCECKYLTGMDFSSAKSLSDHDNSRRSAG